MNDCIEHLERMSCTWTQNKYIVEHCFDYFWFMNDLQHIAIIPDGNRTWATDQWLSAHKGHEAWYERTKEILEHVFEHVESLVGMTFWAMSTENMKKRSKQEKTFLFWLLEKWLDELAPILEKNKIWFMRLGDREWISDQLLQKLDALQQRFDQYKNKTLNLLFNYWGKRHISQAVEACKASWGEIADYMTLGNLPPVDLIVRTKWVQRTSGFLPREDYAERYFTDLMYPDFGVDKLLLAIQDWYTRKRNFGA